MRRGPSSLLLAVLLAVHLGACGSGGGDRTDRTPAAAPTVADAPDAGPVAVTVTEPDNGATVDLHGRRATVLPVAGYAAPASQVSVSADCRPAACRRTVTADGDGRWRVRLRIRTSTGRAPLAISAAPADPASGGAANSILVRLVHLGPAAHRAAAAPRARRPGRPTTVPRTTTVPDPAPVATTPTTPPPSAGPRPGRVFLVGDSLAEGIAALLPAALPGRTVTVDAKTSRPLATGMQLARSAPRGSILAISLFTNDDPNGVARLDAAVRESARLAGPDACAVWATIVRPPVGGVSYAAANARLEALARDPSVPGTVRIVPWARAVAEHPSWVGGDGVHATPVGYRARADLYAQAIDSC